MTEATIPTCPTEPEDPNLRSSQDDALVSLFLNTGFGTTVRFDHLRSQWYYWDAPRWRTDKTRRVYDLVREHANRLWASTPEHDGETRKMILPIFNVSKKESFLKSLSARTEVAMVGDEWDTSPTLLGFDNGIMDLATGVFDYNPGPEVLVSKTVGCDWDPEAPYDVFERFMESIFPDEPEVLRYVYTLLGYCLTGYQREQKFWMWTGRGSNGKGILARTMVTVLGDYAHTPSNALYMRAKIGVVSSNAPRPDLVKLQGVRFTYMSEPPGGQFDENMLKAHTGEDTILARDLFGRANQMAEFAPTHKIIFLTNDPPRTDDVGVSMRRRARLLRFEEDFTGKRADMTMEDRVKAQKPGILRVLVSLAHLWIEAGLEEPEKVLKWSDEYISENDPLSAWVQEHCDLLGGELTGSAVLYGDYQDWCAQNAAEPRSQMAFSAILSKRFRKVTNYRGAFFQGIKLKKIEDRVGDESDE